MTETARARASLEKLLKIARADADALRVDLVDIERARVAAESSMAQLQEAARREEAGAKENSGADLAAYLDGVRERRRNLRTTMTTLASAENNARSRLEAAHVEVKKLEHLIAMHDSAMRKTAARGLNMANDEAAARRRAF